MACLKRENYCFAPVNFLGGNSIFFWNRDRLMVDEATV
jgi:hypothetical protein